MRNDYLMEIVKSIILAEELSNNIRIKQKIELEKPEYTTLVGWLKNVSTPFEVINISGSGELKSIVIKNNNKNFSLKIIADNNVLYDKSWDEYSTISEYIEDIDAFEYNGTYILRISDIKFYKNLLISIYSDSNTVINDIHYKIIKSAK